MIEPESHADSTGSLLREYLEVLRRRKSSVAAVVGILLAGVLAFSFLQAPAYEAEAQVLVLTTSIRLQGTAPPVNVLTETEVATSRTVAELAAERLGIPGDGGTLLSHLSVETEAETLRFIYSQRDPSEARRGAQAFAEAYLDFRRERALRTLTAARRSILEQVDELAAQLAGVNEQIAAAGDELDRANLQAEANFVTFEIALLRGNLAELTPPESLDVGEVVAPADVPTSPENRNHLLNGLAGLVAGLALGVGLAFLQERLDDGLRGRGDLEMRAGAPVLAVIPSSSADAVGPVATAQPSSPAAEAYRTLRTGFLFSASQNAMKTVLATCPDRAEGATPAAANLAVVLAQAGKRVVLVGADLRESRLHRVFDIENEAGLTSVLSGERTARQVMRAVDGLKLLPSGPTVASPAELLGSAAMEKLLVALGKTADFVIVEAPPVLPVADALILARLADGVLLVADERRTSRHAVIEARRRLDNVDASVIGVVLTNADLSRDRFSPHA